MMTMTTIRTRRSSFTHSKLTGCNPCASRILTHVAVLQVDRNDDSKVMKAMKMVNLSQDHHRGNSICACDKDEDGFCEKISERCKVPRQYKFDVCKMLKSAKDKIESIKHKEKLPFKYCQVCTPQILLIRSRTYRVESLLQCH